MLSTTSSKLGTDADDHTEQSPSLLPSTTYLCTSCKISFQNGQEQRIHMKEPWHVYNIKRRMASLPSIPFDAFDIRIEKKIEISEASTSSSSDEETSENEGEQSASPFQCLFCSRDFASDDAGFATNLEHMRTAHGMSIPDPEMVVDMQSFVGYLATEIRVWHECLYCGATKPSTLSIQSHMRDKGHCLLNLDREPELLDFWESPRGVDGDGAALEQEPPTSLSATEIRFASGKVIGSRHAAPAIKKASRKRGLAMRALPPGSEDAELSLMAVGPQLESGRQAAPGRQLARREEMSISGISVQQRQALVSAEKKAQRSEAVARRAREWVYAKGANSQKFDQVDNQMKWGKQNHKLLPR
ncbi:hypothetical protein K505DRAFT_374655 [Melanomma pulvis-pyrius CBS 109.77]|uniref:C2H2-type domain-containing protein n=1 Tax=Melanomma pulvis-pyrius CBS 109.77 TaxID=1314802 RepID=A0A6A6XEC9_9PLEO|nr:hypothetical protein K505DRAFT_374655 [Melanomma pulvis-pyrius CBS 109.77]